MITAVVLGLAASARVSGITRPYPAFICFLSRIPPAADLKDRRISLGYKFQQDGPIDFSIGPLIPVLLQQMGHPLAHGIGEISGV
jgi:hypothetical protein